MKFCAISVVAFAVSRSHADEVHLKLAKLPLKYIGGLANIWLTLAKGSDPEWVLLLLHSAAFAVVWYVSHYKYEYFMVAHARAAAHVQLMCTQ